MNQRLRLIVALGKISRLKGEILLKTAQISFLYEHYEDGSKRTIELKYLTWQFKCENNAYSEMNLVVKKIVQVLI